MHRSIGVTVPVTSRRTSFPGGVKRVDVEVVDLDIGIARADGERSTWFYIGSGPDRYLELSADSAFRLLGAATVELRRMRGGGN